VPLIEHNNQKSSNISFGPISLILKIFYFIISRAVKKVKHLQYGNFICNVTVQKVWGTGRLRRPRAAEAAYIAKLPNFSRCPNINADNIQHLC